MIICLILMVRSTLRRIKQKEVKFSIFFRSSSRSKLSGSPTGLQPQCSTILPVKSSSTKSSSNQFGCQEFNYGSWKAVCWKLEADQSRKSANSTDHHNPNLNQEATIRFYPPKAFQQHQEYENWSSDDRVKAN